MPDLGRRRFLQLAFGATQLALLGGIAGRRARAITPGEGPTKLLTIRIPGGVHWEHFFAPIRRGSTAERLGRVAPSPFYDDGRVENFDGSGSVGSDQDHRPLAGPIRWDWADPRRFGGGFDYKGYGWATPDHRLFDRTFVVHGVDQQTAAHPSGNIASLCGIAGSTFAAPAVQARVADFFLDLFPERVLPSVSIGHVAAPQLHLRAAAAPTGMQRIDDARFQLSDRGNHWNGLRARSLERVPDFDGSATTPLESSVTDRYALWATRRQRGRADSSGSDARLRELYDNYRAVSETLAADVLSTLEATPAFEYWSGDRPSWTPAPALSWLHGTDDGDGGSVYRERFGLALKLLKSDLCTSVALRFNESFDYHDGSIETYQRADYRLRGLFEVIAHVLIEMQQTPARGGTLLDDTLVYIYSDFGRTFQGDDHNPMTSAILVGGGVNGNRMVGGFSESVLGDSIALVDEDGTLVRRPPKSQDVIASILSAFGMSGAAVHLAGGFGVIAGLLRDS